MIKINHVILDELGLHARPAGQLVKMATKYKCDIQAGSIGHTVDAKSILGVMSLALKQGDEMIVTFDGEDEPEAAAAVAEFFEKNV